MPSVDEKKVDLRQESNPRNSRQNRRHRSGRTRGIRSIFKKVRRWFSLRVTLVSLIVMMTVVSVSFVVLITGAVADLRNAWLSLDRVLLTVTNSDGTELTLDDFTRLQTSTSEMNLRLGVTRQRLSFIRPIINLNSEWATTADALDIAQELAATADDLLDGLQPTLNFMVSGDTEEAVARRISSGERLVELLELGQGRFTSASRSLLIAEERLDNVDLRNISPELLLQIEQLRNFHQQLTAINQLLITSPELLTTMLGLDEERSYLVLAQNNDELRPSGGYISTYGWFTVRSGRIIEYDYNPTTATSPNPPNDNFLDERNIIIPDWWIRYDQPVYAAWDGSWFTDFPSTADMAMTYYNAGGNPRTPVDGVLSIDITGFELMLTAMDSVFVPDYLVTVSEDNFRQYVYDIRAFGAGETPHKEFVASIYRAIFNEWSSLGQERVGDLLGAMLEGFQQKHMMLYFADDELNQAITTLGWSGQTASEADSDYLLIADTNLGNKSNHSINQPITYDVEVLADRTLNSRLTIGFEYFDDIASTDPAINPEYHGALDYHSLLQVFLPANTIINDVSNIGNYTLVNEPDYTQLITDSVIEYDSSQRYQIAYTTVPLIQALGDLQIYRLLVQNQAGSGIQALNIQVSLPVDSRVIASSPEADASYNLEQPIIDFRLILNGDIWLEVIYQSE